ncbi:MAG: hypothetical protein N5P05_001495 [Chroococcopsis gigantea SAG 12.99]|jgi:small-conductance mechanosensitive channel|nr:hypothetical protein [Chroococcopsis gigantea SAG 12.99]
MGRKVVLGLICLLTWMTIAICQTRTLAQSQGNFSLIQGNQRIFATGDIEYADVRLDGIPILQVASQELLSAQPGQEDSLSPLQRRVRRIEGTLNHIVDNGFNPKTLEVRPATLNNLTVITASDYGRLPRQVIVTVTQIDAQIVPSTVGDLARHWSEIIRQSLITAREERQPQARRQQIIKVGQIFLATLILTTLLVGLLNWLKHNFKNLQQLLKKQADITDSAKDGNESDECVNLAGSFYEKANLQRQLTLNILLQRIDQISLILLLFAGIAAGLYIFPETRLQGRGLIAIPLKIFIIWLALTIASNLTVLYVNHKLKEWVEQGIVVSSNPERRILRAPTLLVVSRGVITFISWSVAFIWFLGWMGLFVSSFLTGAGLVGAILTFAFQNLLKDWINGFLIIIEDQYTVGDMIEFEGAVTLVENMNLRSTQVRFPADGRLTTIPHNQIIVAHNLTKDWARVNFIIEINYDTDPDLVISLMKAVAEEMAGEPRWRDDIINPVTMIGVNRLSSTGMEIVMRIQVKRLRQFEVDREFRKRLKLTLDQKGIYIGIPKQQLLFP